MTCDDLTRHFTADGTLGWLRRGSRLANGYRVERTLQPHGPNRAGLYVCSAGPDRVMVKVAPTLRPPSESLRAALTTFRHPALVQTLATSVFEDRHYQTLELCRGGNLGRLIPSPASGRERPHERWFTHVLVPQMHAALSYLHDRGWVHRDVKPDNILARDGGARSLALCDFDITSRLAPERRSRWTNLVGATWAYAAPECFSLDSLEAPCGTWVYRESDYYALGITIVELWSGRLPLHDYDLPDLEEYYAFGGSIDATQDMPERLSLLVDGLLLRDRRLRWSAPQVARWIAGVPSEADRERVVRGRAGETPRTRRRRSSWRLRLGWPTRRASTATRRTTKRVPTRRSRRWAALWPGREAAGRRSERPPEAER